MTSAPVPLLAAAEARWTALRATEPDLAPAIALQRRLVTRTIDMVGRLGTLDTPVLSLDSGLAATKLRGATPVLRGEVLALPVDLLAPLVIQACDDLAAGGAGDAARHVRTCLDAGRVELGSLLHASFDRNQTAIRVKATHEGIAPDILWLAAELAAGPAAHVAQQAIFAPGGAAPHPAVSGALGTWPHGYCPACGSWPAFAEDQADTARLRCSFCGFDWPLETTGCIYCGGSADQMRFAASERASSDRAQLCRTCGAYLKRLTVGAPTPFELLPIADLASTELDICAAQQGFGRPSLPELGGPARFSDC